MTKEIVKVLPSSLGKNEFSGDTLRINGISLPSEMDDKACFQSNVYEEIFGEKKKKISYRKKRLSVVKLTSNGRSIHRLYYSVSTSDFTSNFVALTPNSIEALYDADGNAPTYTSVEKGNKLIFYIQHPNYAIRISVRMGLLSIFLGVLSILTAMCLA